MPSGYPSNSGSSSPLMSTVKLLVTTMFADRLSAILLPKISTRSLAMTTTPEPAGTTETTVPGALKFSVLLATTSLS